MTKENKEIKLKLEKMLARIDLPDSPTVSDVEDIIWNATDASDFNRLIGHMIGTENDIRKAEGIIQLIQEAWNTLPHKSLGGKSPKVIAEEYDVNNGPIVPARVSKKRKSLSDVFANSYPDKVRFVKIGKIEWGFEFPKLYHELSEQLLELQNFDISAQEYEKELRRIVRLVPEMFDAVNDLAGFYVYNEDYKQAKRIYEPAVKLAKSYISSEFVLGEHQIIWAYLDNRPFLRLLAGFAQFIEQTEKTSKAIPYYEDIISFNPNDNQGIRGMLATAYIKTNNLEKLVDLSSHYPDDITPELTMGNVLALFKLGRIKEARKYLKHNKKYQMHIIKELLKTTHQQPEELMEDRVTVGGQDEAWYYWQDQGAFWETAVGAKTLLVECLG